MKNDHRSKYSNLSNWKEEAWKKNLPPQFTDETEVSMIFFYLDWLNAWLPGTVKFLPSCFEPEHEDVYLIIDCTELFIKKSSQVIQQSTTWSEYKGHNTGKALISLSPIMLPAFVSEVYPGSISDEEILSESGILALA